MEIKNLNKKEKKMSKNNKILSIDAETNGLYGMSFAIGAVLTDKETGEEEKRFLVRCPIDGLTGR